MIGTKPHVVKSLPLATRSTAARLRLVGPDPLMRALRMVTLDQINGSEHGGYANESDNDGDARGHGMPRISASPRIA